jgi:hypothetical protein
LTRNQSARSTVQSVVDANDNQMRHPS